jgi:DNA polymerase-3 subunit delta
MVYIVYGDQYPIVDKRVKKMVKTLLDGESPDEFNYLRINAREVLAQDIAFEISLLPLGGKKVLRIDNPYFLTSVREKVAIDKDQDFTKLVDALNEDNEGVEVIFVVENKTLNQKSEVYKAVKANGKIVFEEGLTRENLEQTGLMYFQKKGATITREAFRLLLERTGDNLSSFIQEADKLCLYGKDLDVDDVNVMVPVPLEQNAFNIAEALISSNIGQAIKIYRDLLVLKEDPVRLMNLLASQFRSYCEVAYLYQVEKYQQDDIATMLKMHPYRVKMMCRTLTKISYKQILNIIDRLYELDCSIKGMKVDAQTGFEMFLINFNEYKNGK